MIEDNDDLIETVDYNTFTRWEEVDLVVYAFTDLGMKVVINDKYTGLVYKNQVYDSYEEGRG
jgi:predicted RNA-binding protein (virulence factor B family)